MFKVTVKTETGVWERSYQEPLLASKVLADAGIVQPLPCGGRGLCGKCGILLNGKDVLSCQTYIDADAHIDYITKNSSVQGITEGIIRNFAKDPIVSEGFGAAIDIGTTTVAGYLYRFPECELVRSVCVPNPQRRFGADVISRITRYGEGDAQELADSVRSAIAEVTDGFDVKKCVICGNTAMLHLLTKRDPASLAVAPYQAEHLFGEWEGDIYLVRCASAFVGADVMAAVLAVGMTEEETALLIDIGTNGEMALKHKDQLLCCSTAAGPCFEGAGIACGVCAVPGAVNSVSVQEGKLVFTTIDGAEPVGICGSGLVDAVAALLELGVIDETGYMEDKFFFGDSDVYLSPEDVREFQLAKSAIRSGIDTLLHHAQLRYDEIPSFYIAGGFGSFLNVDSAVKTGLIPRELASVARAIGNGAGAGASMILQSRECLTLSERIADDAETVMLADSPYFMDKYIENMMFE